MVEHYLAIRREPIVAPSGYKSHEILDIFINMYKTKIPVLVDLVVLLVL